MNEPETLEFVPESTPLPAETPTEPVTEHAPIPDETPHMDPDPTPISIVLEYQRTLDDLRDWLASPHSVTPGVADGIVLVSRAALEHLASLTEDVHVMPILHGFKACQSLVMQLLEELDVRMRDINSLALHDLRLLMANVRALTSV